MNDNMRLVRSDDEEKREKELSSIDRLFRDVSKYVRGEEFMRKLEFYTHFPNIGAYNAALVGEQRPGARFVLTARKWEEKYKRKIKADARPVIILIPFYPVEFLFDVVDTEPINPNAHSNDNDVIEDIINSHLAECKQDTNFYKGKLELNLPKHGISYKRNYVTGSEVQAEVRVDDTQKISVSINKDNRVEWKSVFSVRVDKNAEGATELALIFHELAHIFCHHINHWWFKPRHCEEKVKEFEAEVVSYLVCARLGINYNPTKYLAEYIGKDLLIPDISLECVFHAVDMIEQAATENVYITKGLLYKNNPDFKALADSKKGEKTQTPRQSF
jgi:hypothetical protein